MNEFGKYERGVAATAIRDVVSFMDRVELTLDCGMIVRFPNTDEGRESVARKIEKGFRVSNPHLPTHPKSNGSIKQVIDRFVKEGDLENAKVIAELHDIPFNI
jgi:hypothetical protein